MVDDGIAEVEHNRSIGSHDDDHEDEEEKEEEHDDDEVTPGAQGKNKYEKEEEAINLSEWNAKVARYLAYCVDGGILCS